MNKIIDGILYIDDINSNKLVEEYGSPLLVMSEDDIREKCRQLKESFLNKYKDTRVAYAAKAFLYPQLCNIINEEGLCLDVVSAGELFTAIKSGFPTKKIEFNGNNKSFEEIEMAIDYGVGRIIVDGVDEIDLIEEICAKKNKTVDILIRFTPGVDSHTHEYITTGNVDSKFGIPISNGILDDIVEKAIGSSKINLLGFHFHVGSQLHDNRSHIMATEILLEMVDKFRNKYGFITRELNLGGGFGIHYTDADDVKPYEYFLEPLMEIIEKYFEEIGEKRPAIVIEPGRSIVGEAGTTLYTIGTVKDIPNVRKYVSVNGGMTDNIRPAMYDSKYECHINSGADEESENNEKEKVTVCGKCCESGDILIRDVLVNSPKRGKVVAIFSTGAYCYSMSSNYNMIGKIPVVMTSKGKSRLVIKGQSYEDLIRDFVF